MGFSRQEYWGGVPSPSLTVVAGSFIYCSCFTDREVEAPRKQVTCSSSLGGAWSCTLKLGSELELGLNPELLGPRGTSHPGLREMPFISALLKGPHPEDPPALLFQAKVGCLVPLYGALTKDPSVSGAVETENLD